MPADLHSMGQHHEQSRLGNQFSSMLIGDLPKSQKPDCKPCSARPTELLGSQVHCSAARSATATSSAALLTDFEEPLLHFLCSTLQIQGCCGLTCRTWCLWAVLGKPAEHVCSGLGCNQGRRVHMWVTLRYPCFNLNLSVSICRSCTTLGAGAGLHRGRWRMDTIVAPQL